MERVTGPPERRESTSSRLVGNAALVDRGKELHDYACQVCETRLQYKRRPYSEAAHIRGLGSPHEAWVGNLGGYQTMTTLAKKVGGPVALAVVTAVSGWAIGRGAEAGGKAAKAAAKKRNAPCSTKGQVFDVVSDGEDGEGLALRAGDRYRVMECDGEAILIEVLGGTNNAYFMSAQFLTSVSGFPTTEKTNTE